MKKTILIISMIAFLLPITLISCKDNKRYDQNGIEHSYDKSKKTIKDKTDDALDKAGEKIDRAVGDLQGALEKAEKRVRNAEEDIQIAINEGNLKNEENARKEKLKAEREIEELRIKIKEKNDRL